MRRGQDNSLDFVPNLGLNLDFIRIGRVLGYRDSCCVFQPLKKKKSINMKRKEVDIFCIEDKGCDFICKDWNAFPFLFVMRSFALRIFNIVSK